MASVHRVSVKWRLHSEASRYAEYTHPPTPHAYTVHDRCMATRYHSPPLPAGSSTFLASSLLYLTTFTCGIPYRCALRRLRLDGWPSVGGQTISVC